ncbi:MAG: phosphoglucosamine mutase [Bacteroidales bacterium]|nr:phosphoglucosamine mutase [Bacteroidales bacterium]MDD2426290.1 phosphoglucosamine mutase [Bacteroidales bacterium]MDD3988899.1 phosphoglucosamine mutase [Bacteroidales bacterium]MDD4638716.1 phosphoglucosamine mutase [Bacteroidales bacterium]
MTLIRSISGIRGTIGGRPGEGLTPLDIVRYTTAFAFLLREKPPVDCRYRVVVARDARVSGPVCSSLVTGTLISCGIDVIDAGMASTPTAEMAVIFEKADGGIILTASHNPGEWNALKLLGSNGEFISASQGERLLETAALEDRFQYAGVESLGKVVSKDFGMSHIGAVMSYPLTDAENIYRSGMKVVVDGVNSVGGVIIPVLLEQMGINCIKINCEPNGLFAHNPEPLVEHLTELSEAVKIHKADLGIAVDPDVDRLALFCEDGTPFGEEYTLVAAADYVLSRRPGNTVSNLSSTRALRDITESSGGRYYASAVGEVNVVEMMKSVSAVIGGEGNGGVIVPDLHYGRDALIGVALILSSLSEKGCKASTLRDSFPRYHISKKRFELPDIETSGNILSYLKEKFRDEKITDIDGVKIEFESERSWIHIRRSNTEPIIRIYSEAPDREKAGTLGSDIIRLIRERIK